MTMLARLTYEKLLVFTNASVPLAMLLWDAWRGNLGANPVEFATRTTGMLALVFLLLSLAVTPVRRFTGRQALAVHRRTLGLFAFFYATLHLVTYAGFDKAFSIADVAADVAKRPFIFFGMAAFLLLVPLAATSTKATIKRLGGTWWRRLHSIVYAAAPLAVVHYILLVKVVTRLPLAFAFAVAALLATRIYYRQAAKAKAA